MLPDTSTGLSTLRPRGALGFGLAKIYKSIYIFSFYVLFAFLLIKSKIDLMRGFVDFLFNELRGCYVRQAPHRKSRFPVRKYIPVSVTEGLLSDSCTHESLFVFGFTNAHVINKNKVDTTYRCEALKEVMSFKCVKSQILKYIHLHQTPSYQRYKMFHIF